MLACEDTYHYRHVNCNRYFCLPALNGHCEIHNMVGVELGEEGTDRENNEWLGLALPALHDRNINEMR